MPRNRHEIESLYYKPQWEPGVVKDKVQWHKNLELEVQLDIRDLLTKILAKLARPAK